MNELSNSNEAELRSLAASIMGRKGSAVRNGSMTPEQRSAHGKMMVAVREAKRKERRKQQGGANNESSG